MPTLNNKTIVTNSKALIAAAMMGNLAEVNRLIPISNPKFRESHALYQAVKLDYTDIAAVLIPHSNVNANKGAALSQAIQNRNDVVFDILLPLTKTHNNCTHLCLAIYYEYIDMVKKLLPVSNVPDDNNRALFSACMYEQWDCVELLLPLSDYNKVLQDLKDEQEFDVVEELEQYIVQYTDSLYREELLHTVVQDTQYCLKNSKRKI